MTIDGMGLARIVASDTTGVTDGEDVPYTMSAARRHVRAEMEEVHARLIEWLRAYYYSDVVGTLVLTPDTVREMG